MRTPILLVLASALLGLAMSGCANGPTSEAYANVTTKTKKTMRALGSLQMENCRLGKGGLPPPQDNWLQT